MVHRLYPGGLNTFNTYEYQLFTIEDRKEQNREYTMNTYMNSHGYGDATTTVYVGGTDKTSCKVNPGEYTYVKITFYNNAGFDWIMKEEAIPMNLDGYSVTLNAQSAMSGKVTAIQYPKEYNFMSPQIPEEIRPYITLTPSQHLKDIAPQFFDLTFNNVLEIKDALEGDYYYMLNVTDDFPDKYKGKLWEIKMVLNEEYFIYLPGVNDPTDEHNVHDYHITIPSIKFGVPYNGKVYYNLGQAKDIYFTYRIYKNFQIEGIKIVTEDEINKLSLAVADEKNKYSELEKVWEEIEDQEEISKKIVISLSSILKNLIDVKDLQLENIYSKLVDILNFILLKSTSIISSQSLNIPEKFDTVFSKIKFMVLFPSSNSVKLEILYLYSLPFTIILEGFSPLKQYPSDSL